MPTIIFFQTICRFVAAIFVKSSDEFVLNVQHYFYPIITLSRNYLRTFGKSIFG